jgi:hypothetical protein
MHLEIPKLGEHSIKDFARHYLMIVLSILTALGLEAWIEHAHHRHAGDTARAQIEAEIRANLDEVRAAMAKDDAQTRKLAEVRDMLVQDFAAHTSEADMVKHIQARISGHGFSLNLMWPNLRHEAWDVAVANQSASWIDTEHMRRYTAAYAMQRDVTQGMSTDVALVVNGPRMEDTITDLRTNDVQPRDFLHVVAEMSAILETTSNNLADLEKRLQAALPDAPPDAAAKAS